MGVRAEEYVYTYNLYKLEVHPTIHNFICNVKSKLENQAILYVSKYEHMYMVNFVLLIYIIT